MIPETARAQSIAEKARFRSKSLAPPLTIFAVNVWIGWRLFHTEYLNQMLSIEGAFIALAQYIRGHWALYDWFGMWHAGFPFWRCYQPLLHFTVAATAAATGVSTASAYHFVIALGYSLGGVAFYFLVREFTESRWAAFCGGMLFSTFSVSVLLPGIRHDVGGWRNARRLQALVSYGESPNTTGLVLVIFALAMLHRAMKRRTAGSAIAAAFALALVPAASWPATVALSLAMASYAVAITFAAWRREIPRLALIAALAAAMVLPVALPDTVRSALANANSLVEPPTPGAPRWIALALTGLCFAGARLALRRAPFGLRFAALFSIAVSGIVLPYAIAQVRVTPEPVRFHLALEIGLTLLIALGGWWICRAEPRISKPLVAVALLFFAAQAWHYRSFARSIIQPVDIRKTIEYQEAVWFDHNEHGARVETPGSISFWMNVWTETPQLTGMFDPSVLTKTDIVAAFVTSAGFGSDAQSADYTELWLKAFAVDAFALGGPASREYYHAFQFPYRFRGRLPVVWSSGDDYIYRVPERTAGLARVVRPRDLVRDTPENGIDAKELRPFVAALDDASLPVASSEWRDVNDARIRARMTRDEVISFAVNYHPGWHAMANGHPAAVRSDGLGLAVIEPECEGDCTIDLRWSAGAEPWLCCAISGLAFGVAIFWWMRERAYGQSART